MVVLQRVRRFGQVRTFLDHVGGWLGRDEIEHGLQLGLLNELARGAGRYRPPLYLGAVGAAAVEGCALRTPPHPLLLTRMPPDAVPLLVEDVAEVYGDHLPGTIGPPETAGAFGERWSVRCGCTAVTAQRMRLHAAREVRAPSRPPPGRLRPASPGEQSLLESWLAAFAREAAMDHLDPASLAAWLVERRTAFVWDLQGPRSMAATLGETTSGVRIAYVYTPLDMRGRGYAGAAVAELTRLQIAGGKRFCTLYTDLANPVSNRIYERIGYRAVSDWIDVRFVVRRQA